MVFGGCFGSGTRGNARGSEPRAGAEPTTITTTTTKRTMDGRLASSSNRSARAEAHALERRASRSGGDGGSASRRRSKSKRSKTKRKDKRRNAGTFGSGMYSGSESEESLEFADDGDGFGSESSGRTPDFGIDRATYRANVANGVETNAALREWLKRREMWKNAGRRRDDGDGEGKQATKKMSVPRAASYDTLLGYDRPSGAFKRPIRLADMVYFLNDCWADGEGL